MHLKHLCVDLLPESLAPVEGPTHTISGSLTKLFLAHFFLIWWRLEGPTPSLRVQSSYGARSVFSVVSTTSSAIMNQGKVAERYHPSHMLSPCKLAGKATLASFSKCDGTRCTSHDGKQTKSPASAKKW